MREQEGPDHGDVGEARNRYGGKRRQMDADRLGAAGQHAHQVARQPEREDIHRQSSHHIVGAETHGDDRDGEPDRGAAGQR